MDGVVLAVVVVLVQYATGSLIEIGVVAENVYGSQVITHNGTGHVGRIHWFDERNGSVFHKVAQISSMRNRKLDLIIAPDPMRGKSVKFIRPESFYKESWNNRYRLSSSTEYPLEPPLSDHLDYTSKLIHNLEWNSTTILSDREISVDSHSLARGLSRLGVKSELVFVKKDGNLKFLAPIMEQIGMDNMKLRLRFVLMCSLPLIRQILKEAEDLDACFGKGSLFRHFSQWILLLPRSTLRVIEGMDLKLDHVAVISRSYKNFDIRKLTQWVVNTTLEVLSTEQTWNRSDATDHFLRIVRREDDMRTVNTMLHTLLWKPHGRKLSSVQHDASHDDVFPNRKLGLNQRKLRAAALEWLPFVKRYEQKDGSVVYKQASIELANHLGSVLNFTYSVSEPADKEWGLPVSGNYTGMLGMLQRAEVDFVAVPVGYTQDRDLVADYLPVIFESTGGMLLRNSRSSARLSSALTDPFRWQVYAVGGAVLIGVILLYLAMEWNNPFYTDAKSMEKGLKPAGFLDTVMYLFGSTIHQGGVHLPESSSGRMLISFWWLFIIVMTAAYSGNLIASLTVTKESFPFTTLEDLLADEDLRVGLAEGTVLQRVMMMSNDSKIRRLWEKIEASRGMDSNTFNKNVTVQRKKVLNENYAFISDIIELEVITRSFCDLYILEETFQPGQYSLVLQQDSPLKDMFSKEIRLVEEIGLMQYWLRKWNPRHNDSACSSTEAGAKPIGLEKLVSVSLALLAGILCSGLCLLIELVVKASATLM
ncbi:glutamate receptor ionotropic, delta-2-like [Haliotis rufescens]|uniref:glutamate receptor ionotropic, delta-2-like n=1 Tax=Haliotis rufescens TaxID=6454 RepID=UPI00201E919A|nr:glutamate receptor ionotropic, delta-2-like [Haliotis rufescens]